MLSYEEFKKAVVEGIKDYLPEMFAHAEVAISIVPKVNEMLEAMNVIIVQEDKDAFVGSPNIYLKELYGYYVQEENFKRTMRRAATIVNEGYRQIGSMPTVSSLENKKNQIIMVLINTEKNTELLKEVPHESFLDLSVIYRIVMHAGSAGMTSAIVRYDMLDLLGVDENELLELAMENSRRLLVPRLRNLSDVMCEFVDAGVTGNDKSILDNDIFSQSPLYVLTNQAGINGAATVAYGDELRRLADELDDDLYILPSSIHEVMAISSSFASLSELREMVRDINATQVAPNEVLSDQVYIFERDTGHLRIA